MTSKTPTESHFESPLQVLDLLVVARPEPVDLPVQLVPQLPHLLVAPLPFNGGLLPLLDHLEESRHVRDDEVTL